MTPVEIGVTQEVIKVGKNLFTRLFGPVADQYGLMFDDNVKVRRFANQVKNLQKIKTIIESENISIKEVNLKALVPFMENVSLEEDESLQDIWARLMVNYLDSSKNLINHVFPSILAQLSTLDIEILNFMRNNSDLLSLKWGNNNPHAWNWKMLVNLERLSIVREDVDFKTSYDSYKSESPNISIEQSDTGNYILTPFGSDFMDACTR